MAVKKLRPVTPGQRYRMAPSFEELTASKPEKSLLKGIKKSGGRNNSGRMTMRYLGGGHINRNRKILTENAPRNNHSVQYHKREYHKRKEILIRKYVKRYLNVNVKRKHDQYDGLLFKQ